MRVYGNISDVIRKIQWMQYFASKKGITSMYEYLNYYDSKL